MRYKATQYILPFLKALVVVLCFYFLYSGWLKRPFHATFFKEIARVPWYIFGCMAGLSILSWLVESKKWQLLVRNLWGIRFRESVIQNLTAQAASFITPLRAGEIVYKSLFFTKTLRTDIALRVVTGNLCQMATTVILGSVAAVFYLKEAMDTLGFLFICGSLLFMLVVCVVLWLQQRFKLETVAPTIVWQATGLSFVRYVLFAANWPVLLIAMSYDMPPQTIVINTLVMYLAVSLVPLMPLVDIPVKLTVAAFVFEGGEYGSDAILLTTSVIWITNTVLPTVIGCAMIPFKKLAAA